MKWIRCVDELPPLGKYVLCIHTMGTWIDRGDPERVNCVVAKRMKELSFGHGNNLLPFRWAPFGPDSFFGQDISHWCWIDLPDDLGRRELTQEELKPYEEAYARVYRRTR